tara:strand:- start:4667 stop:5830 length:1164 start_codon:yes stop_codon:yes gene_type:complete
MAIKGKQIASLDASKIGAGVFNADRIPDLAAGKIVSGTFDVARIPNLNADKITAGVLTTDRIPNLSANKINADTLGVDRIPALDTAKITTGTFADARIASTNVTQHLGGANVKTALGQSFPDNTVSIGDSNATVTIPGNLTVTGTTTSINSTTLDLADHNISFDSDNNTGTFAAGAGFTIVRGNSQAALTFSCDTNGAMSLKIGSDLSALNVGSFNAENYNLQASDIPNLAAAKITSGEFDVARIPNLAAGKITSGIFATDRIPDLAAAKISSGTFPAARLGTDSVLADKVKWQKEGLDGPASPSGSTSTLSITGKASTQSNGIPDGNKALVFLNGVLLEEAPQSSDVGSQGDYFLEDNSNDKDLKVDNNLLTDDSDRLVIRYIATT